MPKVGYIWIIDNSKAAKIHKIFTNKDNFKSLPIEILVSENCERWYAGSSIYNKAATCNIGSEFESFTSLYSDQKKEHWNALRDALVKGDLGVPDVGCAAVMKTMKDKAIASGVIVVNKCSTCKREKYIGTVCWWCGN